MSKQRVSFQILDRNRLEPIRRFETKDPGVKVEFHFQRAAYRGSLAEAVPFPFKRHICKRQTLSSKDTDQDLCLRRRNNRVLHTLQKNYRCPKTLGVAQR